MGGYRKVKIYTAMLRKDVGCKLAMAHSMGTLLGNYEILLRYSQE
jgi:hypothetical protein